MRCPHCQSTMIVTQESDNDISRIQFLECTICSAEHVICEPASSQQPGGLMALLKSSVLIQQEMEPLH